MDFLAGTFLKTIIEIAVAGKFTEAPDTPKINDGDTFLGEATPLEKACRTFAINENEKAKAMVDSGISIKSDDVQAILMRSKIAEDTFWLLMTDRFGKKIAIRQDWQIIVEDSGEEECDCPICRAERQSSIPDGIMVIEVSMSEGKPESGMMGNLLSRIFNDPAGIFARRG